MKACDNIKKYLPFNNKVLDNLKTLNPEENDFNGLIVLGEKFPNVINMFERSKLVLEIDELNVFDKSNIDKSNIIKFWGHIMNLKESDKKTPRFPLLIRLVQFLLILPHGSCDVERIFSHRNIVKNKLRTSLNNENL